MNWNDGYRIDINYTFGYYADLNPANIKFCLVLAGYHPPVFSTACELGYGQGLSLNIHAAAEQTSWYGTDFNPSQAAFAQEMAAISRSHAHCLADSFQDFAKRDDLPDFDYIALHGIWSWISPENQKTIIEIIARKLKPGGVLYLSYNTNPGWAAFIPTRNLLELYARGEAGAGDVTGRMKKAFDFVEKLKDSDAAYFRNNPSASVRLDRFQNVSQPYAAHELFNRFWTPCLFSELASQLSEARLTYAASAEPLQNVPGLGFTQAQQEIMAQISDPVLAQTVHDFILNSQFRKDIWIKGPRQPSPRRTAEMLRRSQFILTAGPDKIPDHLDTAFGEVTFSPAMLRIFHQGLGDGQPHSLGQLLEMARGTAASAGADKENVSLLGLAHNMAALQAGGLASPCQPEEARIASRASAARLNNFIIDSARDSGDIAFLASPVTGGGIAVQQLQQLFMLAWQNGADNPSGMASLVSKWLPEAGQTLLRDGKPIGQEEAAVHLENLARTFLEDSLPVYKNLQLA